MFIHLPRAGPGARLSCAGRVPGICTAMDKLRKGWGFRRVGGIALPEKQAWKETPSPCFCFFFFYIFVPLSTDPRIVVHFKIG